MCVIVIADVTIRMAALALDDSLRCLRRRPGRATQSDGHPSPARRGSGLGKWDWRETDTVRPNDTIRRIANGTKPTLTVYLPPREIATGTAMVISARRRIRYRSAGAAKFRPQTERVRFATIVLKYHVRRLGDPAGKHSVRI